MLVEPMRFKSKLPFDDYKEIIQNDRRMAEQMVFGMTPLRKQAFRRRSLGRRWDSMKKAERAVELFRHGHLCSQAVLKLYAKECGITDEQAMKLGTGFGTGMKKGEVCGACTGALMVHVFSYYK